MDLDPRQRDAGKRDAARSARGYAKEVREEGERESNMAVSRHGVVAGQQPVGKRTEAASLAELCY